MSTLASSKPRSRLAGLLVFFGIPAALLTVSALNALESDDSSYIAAEKEFQLSALMRKLTAPAKDGQPLDLSQIYFGADTATVASADLQQRVERSISMASGKIIETAPMELETEADKTLGSRIGVKATFDIGNEGLLALLRGLETGLPLVFVEKLSIRRLPADNNREIDSMRVDLEIAAQWKAVAP